MMPSFLKSALTQRFKRCSFPSFPSHQPQNLPKKQEEKVQQAPIQLYDVHSIENCSWPQNPEGRHAQQFLTPLIKQGVSSYIENIQTDLRVLIWDELALPITINHAEYDNSYVCSPYSYYISYAKESLGFLTQSWTFYALQMLLRGAAKLLRHYQVNKVVIVNNWLYSTNLYPSLQSHQLGEIAQFLRQQFPDHAIIFRSVDPYTSPVCYQNLKNKGFEYIASRQIYFIDPHRSPLFESRLFKSDLKLLQNSGYEIIEGDQISESDFPHLLKLYYDLYIHKYSHLNPKFNQAFLQLLIKQGLMRFKALRKNGKIDGVVGYVERNGMMICPFFGYDRTLPKEIALYRLLSTVLMLEAHHRHLFFHQSSGASTYKKIRKAESCIEYMAVYYRHLNARRQLPWVLLKNMCNSLGLAYMERY